MEKDKYISLGDSYIEIQGDEKEVARFNDDILNGNIKFELSTKSLPKTPVNITKKYLKNTSETVIFLFYYVLQTTHFNIQISLLF